MKTPVLLSAALALLLPVLPVVPAHGQGIERSSNTRAAKRARQQGQQGVPKEAEQAPLYPLATRKNPVALGDRSVEKQMEELIKLQAEDGKEDQVIAKADEILASPKANAFDKSRAAYVAGAAWQGKESNGYANASKYYRLALDNNGLQNNIHYRAMLQLAQMQAADGHNAEGLATVERFFAETKSEDETAVRIKTQILLGMDKPAAAAAALEKMVAAKPGDKMLMLNLAALYVESNQEAKAGAIFDKVRAAGLLTESKDYETGMRLLGSIEGREKEALALIDEGLKKGVLQPSYEMYVVQGHGYYEAGDNARAIEAWGKGAPLSKDGEMYLNLAKLQLDSDHWAAAKEAATKAQAKGVKNPGDAWRVIARAETGLGNAAAAKAASAEAAKHGSRK